MNRLLPISVLTASLIGGFTGCSSARDDVESIDRVRETELPCRAAYETPAYTRPADDGVALESLLEGAGYGAPSNSDWTDVAAGNFCGDPGKELVLLKNRPSNFSILRGPTPYAVSAFDSPSEASHPWKAVAAGNLDNDPFDEIVAVRNVTATGVADAVVLKVGQSACDGPVIVARTSIGNPVNSKWLDAAIGNFDGTGPQVALIKDAHNNFFLAKLAGSSLEVSFSSDLDTSAAYPWKALAAGDLDGDGIDELVAAREVADGRGTTVLAYKWTGETFEVFARSRFGNTGNSDWSSMAVGDFDGDGHAAIALAKDHHSNFAVLDLPRLSRELRVVATADLDSASGQEWRGLAATDWLGTDQGAAELVAVRAAKAPYRADLFVYGNRFHRVPRDTALEGTKGQWDQARGHPSAKLMRWMDGTHTNTLIWHLGVQPADGYPKTRDAYQGDYRALVEFLKDTQGFCVDRMQIRVGVTLVPPHEMRFRDCSLPSNSDVTPWNEFDYFRAAEIFGAVLNSNAILDDRLRAMLCLDYLAWASVIGRLAQDYPHLVSLGIDDFLNHPEYFPGEVIAEMQSRMRSQAPWLTFVPTAYYRNLSDNAPDMARTFDTMIFYFRNEKEGQCLAGTCGENSVGNAPEEFAEAIAFLPAGRKLQVGTYWGILYPESGPDTGTARYDYDLVRLVRSMPEIGGVTAYPMQAETDHFVACTDSNFLEVVDGNKFCTLQRAFGDYP